MGRRRIYYTFPKIDIDNAESLTERLRIMIENNIKIQELLSYSLTVSIGLTQFKQNDDINCIINRADDAMYLSKDTGKNKISVL